jgi:hypothetical protein
MNTYLQGRRLTVSQDDDRLSPEVLHLMRKLRRMGLEAEAERMQMKLRDVTPTGGVITAAHETD